VSEFGWETKSFIVTHSWKGGGATKAASSASRRRPMDPSDRVCDLADDGLARTDPGRGPDAGGPSLGAPDASAWGAKHRGWPQYTPISSVCDEISRLTPRIDVRRVARTL